MAFVLKINKKEVVFAERTPSGFWFLRFAPLRPQRHSKLGKLALAGKLKLGKLAKAGPLASQARGKVIRSLTDDK